MSFLRTISTRRLVALAAGVVAVASGGTAVALAGGGGVPPAKPLALAAHDALAAPSVEGVTARISFTNHLIDGASLEGANPVLTGATGRLWLSADHRLRLELQSTNGDAQVVFDGHEFSLYDTTSNTVYRGQLPQHPSNKSHDSRQTPSLAQIQSDLNKLAGHAVVSPTIPSDVADRPAYTVRVGPKRNGGLLGAAELAWDAQRGIPLRIAIYARGNSSPVLELRATDISYGPVPASVFRQPSLPGAKVVHLTTQTGTGATDARSADAHGTSKPVVGVAAVSAAVPFTLAAPNTLAGQPRATVRLLDWKGSPAALVTYGQGLGGIAVIERTGRATRQELDTPLGTMIRFQRGGVAYTVLGSVAPEAARAAAGGL